MKLIHRQLFVLCVPILYIIFTAWIKHSSKNSVELLDELNEKSNFKFIDQTHLDKDKDYFETWLEPVSFIAPNSTIVNVNHGLYYITKHSHFIKKSLKQKSSGLVKIYQLSMEFSKTLDKEQKIFVNSNPELLFVDSLPGPILGSSLDKTRELEQNGLATSKRRLAFLYYVNSGENIQYYARIYDIDDPVPALSKASFEKTVSSLLSINFESNPKDKLAVLPICPSYLKNESYDFDQVYSDQNFKTCVGTKNLRLNYIDYKLPGTTEITNFSIKDNKIIYTRRGDSFSFRFTQFPINIKGDLVETNTELVSSSGPLVHEKKHSLSNQFKTVMLSTNRNPNFDIATFDGWMESNSFKFKILHFQNYSKSVEEKSSFFSNMFHATQEEWLPTSFVRYSLGLGNNYNSLENFEKNMIVNPPLVDQISRTTICYFYITQVILTIDTLWKIEGDSSITQFHNLSSINLSEISTNPQAEITKVLLDDSGSNGDFDVYHRGLAPQSAAFNQHTETNVATKRVPIPVETPKNKGSKKSNLFKIPSDSEGVHKWNLASSWESQSENAELWGGSSNENSKYRIDNGYYYYESLTGISPVIHTKYGMDTPINSPSSIGGYFVSLRVFMIDKTTKNMPKPDSQKNNDESDNSKSLNESVSKTNDTNPILVLAGIKNDGSIKFFLLDGNAQSPRWLLSFIFSHPEMLMVIFIITLWFVNYESRCT
ncbi:hypothetical protein BB559_000486 [Furculomyces boomerangus]|uniref:Uncharacterized protein n=2 Tax=Harpellales TaxID=61421 RepID=A0A2T9Z4Z8_9FUNG|nr:hypothetical protein BB559_000486 [Furculomyces boomerangus]PVZ99621.1 hypothetical protein BB558_004346 [Smittium angustum]